MRHAVLDRLIRLANCDSYRAAQAHSDFRSLMTWSINWDRFGGFAFLIFNVVYMFLAAFFYLICNPQPLKESYVEYIPKTAIIYPLKNESVGMLERVLFTFSNNNLPGVDLWILSDYLF